MYIVNNLILLLLTVLIFTYASNTYQSGDTLTDSDFITLLDEGEGGSAAPAPVSGSPSQPVSSQSQSSNSGASQAAAALAPGSSSTGIPSAPITQSVSNTPTGTVAVASSSTSASSSSSSSNVPSYNQFCAAVASYSKTTAGGTPPTPSQDVYNSYCQYVANMTIKEQAMFLANAIWETGGLQYLSELGCSDGSCSYGQYYGRGYLQLTWDYNYQAASTALYGDSRLMSNPDLAAQSPGSWQTALWYWNTSVHPTLVQNNAIDTYEFGYSVMEINGAIECPSSTSANNRLVIYNSILSGWNIASNNPGTLTGCT